MKKLLGYVGEVIISALLVLLITFGWFPLTIAASFGCAYVLRTSLPLAMITLFALDAVAACSIWFFDHRRARRGPDGVERPSRPQDGASLISKMRGQTWGFTPGLIYDAKRIAAGLLPSPSVRRVIGYAALGALALASSVFVFTLLFELRSAGKAAHVGMPDAGPTPAIATQSKTGSRSRPRAGPALKKGKAREN